MLARRKKTRRLGVLTIFKQGLAAKIASGSMVTVILNTPLRISVCHPVLFPFFRCTIRKRSLLVGQFAETSDVSGIPTSLSRSVW